MSQENILAAQVYQAVQQYDPVGRTARAQDFRIGVSDLGGCREAVRRMILQEKEEPTDGWAAFVGSAVGDRIEAAVTALFPEAQSQVKCTLQLEGVQGTYRIFGTADIVLPHLLIEIKTVDGLDVVEKTGPTRQQLYQRHCNAKAAHAAGHFAVPLEEVQTANIWADRSGRDRRFHCHLDHFDEAIVKEAAEWLDDSVYAARYNELAQKDKPRECWRFCGYAPKCRGDSDVTGLIENPEQLAAIDAYQEGGQREREGKKMRETAKRTLAGINGSTGQFAVRWVHVPEIAIQAHTKRGYDKLSITRLGDE